MSKLEKLKNFIREKDFVGIQTFNSRNVVGDPMVTIYNQDGIVVDCCYFWGYLEIFGLTEEEYLSLSDVLDIY